VHFKPSDWSKAGCFLKKSAVPTVFNTIPTVNQKCHQDSSHQNVNDKVGQLIAENVSLRLKIFETYRTVMVQEQLLTILRR